MSSPARWLTGDETTDIGDLRGATDEEEERFRGQGWTTVEALWAAAAEKGLPRVASDVAIPTPRLLALLAAYELDKADGKHRFWLARFWLEALLITVAAFLIFELIDLKWNSRDTFVVTTRDLRAGAPLGADDLSVARIGIFGHYFESTDYFPTRDRILPPRQAPGSATQRCPGLAPLPALTASSITSEEPRLARDVPAGRPLRFADVLTPQVVATRDIPIGAIVTSDAMVSTSAPYRPEAFGCQPLDFAGRAAQVTIRAGDPLTPASVGPAPRFASQVVASRALSPLETVASEDVRIEFRPWEPGALLAVDDVLGRYPVQEVPAGATVRVSHLGVIDRGADPAAIAAAGSITVEVAALSQSVQPGSRVSLVFSPRSGPPVLVLHDVLVLDVARQAQGGTLVVRLPRAALMEVVPRLRTSDVSVIEPAP